MIQKVINKVTQLLGTQCYYFTTKQFNCKMVSEEIQALTRERVAKIGQQLKITVILAHDSQGKPDPASEIYIRKKLELMPLVGIQSELIRVQPSISKAQMEALIDKLNADPTNTSTLVQLPFPPEYRFDIHEMLNRVQKNKNVDGFVSKQTQESNITNPNTLKPPTALGIIGLLSYYGIQTEGKNIAIIGKGALVGLPLTRLLSGYPFYATVTACDIFTEYIGSITRKADIIISACGQAEHIKADDIKEDAILIDAGINPIKADISTTNHKIDQLNSSKYQQKRRIIGDICRSTYTKARHYTSVPGGVGLLTVASLAFNVLNSHLLQRGLPMVDLTRELRFKYNLSQQIHKITYKTKSVRIMLLSSAYNGLTQLVHCTLNSLSYETYFQLASSDTAMREGVANFRPNLIICPTLMKAIPEDIYKAVKCLIVHPGVRGDRGPSSLDWAILNAEPQWGVTLLQASREMDAGDIWATENFLMSNNKSKVEVYNTSIVSIATRLILKAVGLFEKGTFIPEKLDYFNPAIIGRLHRTIKHNDMERTVDWETQTTSQIMRKALAADTQPGLKVTLILGQQRLTRFTYGFVAEKQIVANSSVRVGQIFLKKHQAVCVKTVDGAVWIRQMRLPKSAGNPNPFKVPSTVHFGRFCQSIPEVQAHCLHEPIIGTFQQITFQLHGQIGILGFDFYNGAMSTEQCLRLAAAVQKVGALKTVKVLILAGSQKAWSNGIHLNVIETASNPPLEAWNNILAINNIVKNIYKMSDKITISALQANAGAGGVYLGLAADYCFAKNGIVLNPHYKNMGLFGSQLHTATAAKKFGNAVLRHLKDSAQPMLVSEAKELKVIDELHEVSGNFIADVKSFAESLIVNPRFFRSILAKKAERQRQCFKFKSLQQYESQELDEMRKDMFEDRHGFAAKRSAFVRKLKT